MSTPGLLLPRKLLNKHIQNARLVEDRIAQLHLLPKNGIVLEIGSYLGYYADEILKITNPKKLYLIEICTKFADDLKIKFKKEITEGKIEVINESSFTAHKHFKDAFFDWIYIDADHKYESVSKDINNFAPKIKPNGFMVHNDYILYDWIAKIPYGTMHAINEFCIEKNWEIIYYTFHIKDFKDVVLRKI